MNACRNGRWRTGLAPVIEMLRPLAAPQQEQMEGRIAAELLNGEDI